MYFVCLLVFKFKSRLCYILVFCILFFFVDKWVGVRSDFESVFVGKRDSLPTCWALESDIHPLFKAYCVIAMITWSHHEFFA